MISLVERHTPPEKIYSRHVIIEKKGCKTYDNIMNVFSDMFWYELYKEVPMDNLRTISEYLGDNLFAPLLGERSFTVYEEPVNPWDLKQRFKIEVGEYMFTLSSDILEMFDFTHQSFKSNRVAYDQLKAMLNTVWEEKEERIAYIKKF